MDQSTSFSNLTWGKCYHHIDIFTDHEACLCFSPVYTSQSTDVTLFVCALQCITPVDFFHNFFMLHFFHIVLCSCCFIFMMHLSCFVIFLMIGYFYVVLFSVLHFLHAAFSSCWKTFILYFGLFSCIFFQVTHFHVATCCAVFMLLFFRVAPFSCCTFIILKNIENEQKKKHEQKNEREEIFCLL